MEQTRLPLHPIFVHFPIALLGTSLLFDIIGLITGSTFWWSLSFWNISIGLIAGVVAAVTGLVDSLQVTAWSKASRYVTRHLLANASALIAYGIALLIRGGSARPTGGALAGTLIFEVIGLGLLFAGGYLGGEMVFHLGLGQRTDSPERLGPPSSERPYDRARPQFPADSPSWSSQSRERPTTTRGPGDDLH